MRQWEPVGLMPGRTTIIDDEAWSTWAAQRCAAAEPLVGAQRGESRPDDNSGLATSVVAGTRVVANRRVGQPWATSAYLLDGYPGPEVMAAVTEWLARHAAGPYSVVTRLRHGDDPGWARHGLVPWEDQPVFATAPSHAARLEHPTPAGVALATPDGVAEFWQGYGCWMPDLDASAIVPLPLFERRDCAFLVARVDQVPVGSAIVRWVDATGYLGGIGVRQDRRGVGIGTALTAAASRLAASGPAGDGRDADGQTIDLVWMHASRDGVPVYARMGFTAVDDHVILASSAS